MALGIGDAILKLGLDTTGLDKGLQGVQGKLNNAASKMTGIGKSMSMKVTAPIVAAGIAAFKFAGDFDQAMRQTNVMLEANGEEFEGYKKQILAISSATGKSATDVASAFYQVVSAGYRGADAVDILTVAIKGAVGGAADAEQTTAALVKAMNIFEFEGVGGASKAMDSFFGIVDSGLLTFEEMASAFPRAASNAAGLGMSIGETGATLATLSKVLGSTEQAATATDAIFRTLISPSGALKDLYTEWGVKSGPEAIEKFGGLSGVLEKLEEATGGEVTAIRELFQSDEAMKGILPLLTSSYDAYGKAVDTVTNSQGRTNEALDEMTQGPGFQMKQMLTTLKNLSITLGDSIATTLGPTLEKLIGWLQKVANWFTNLPAPVKKTIIVIVGVAAAVGPLLLMLGMMLPAITAITAALKFQSIAMVAHKVALLASAVAIKVVTAAQWLWNVAMSANPIGLIILAIAALIAIVILVVKNWDWVKEKALAIWGAIVGFFKKVGEKVKDIFLNMTPVGLLIKHWDTIKEKASEIWGKITGFFKDTGNKIKNTFEKNWEDTKTAASTIWNAMTKNSEKFGGGLKGNILSAMEATATGFKGFLEKMGIDTEAITKRIRDIWEGVMDFFRNIPQTIEQAFRTLKDIMLAPFRFAIKGIEIAINWLIKQINKIHVKVPKWVLGIGGKEFGFNIPKFSLPKFAKGGLITEPTLLYGLKSMRPYGVAGEAGTEVISPTGAGITNNFNIAELVVREEADIPRIARELYRMQQSKVRLVGA